MNSKFDLYDFCTSKRVEPKQRLVGGNFGYAFHRFPIKGGVSVASIMADNISKSNELMKRLTKNKIG